MDEKKCPKCEKVYPLTAEYWHRNKNMKDGLAGHCKKCVNKSNSTEDISYNIKTEKELTYQGIPKVSMELGHKYKFIVPAHGNDKKTYNFEGVVIQDTERPYYIKTQIRICRNIFKMGFSSAEVSGGVIVEEQEILQITELIPYKNFKEKIAITKEYDRKAKMQIIDDKFVYVELKEVAI